MDSTYKILLRNSLIAVVICVALVTLSYFFVDRTVTNYVYSHNIYHHHWLTYLTYPADFIYIASPIVTVIIMIYAAWRPLTGWAKIFLTASLNVMVTFYFKNGLKYVFGRYWPLTWKNNNPSLIRDHFYGFHPFHAGVPYASFPSGHAAVTFAAMMVIWFAYPRWRWLSVLVCACVCVGLVCMDYHFVGDIIAGAFLGTITAAYAAKSLS